MATATELVDATRKAVLGVIQEELGAFLAQQAAEEKGASDKLQEMQQATIEIVDSLHQSIAAMNAELTSLREEVSELRRVQTTAFERGLFAFVPLGPFILKAA